MEQPERMTREDLIDEVEFSRLVLVRARVDQDDTIEEWMKTREVLFHAIYMLRRTTPTFYGRSAVATLSSAIATMDPEHLAILSGAIDAVEEIERDHG